MLPALGEAVASVFRGARDAFKESGPTELQLNRPDGAKGYGDVSFDPVSVAWYARNGYANIAAAMGGGMPAWAGESVSLHTAMNHSVVWACNRLISETQGATPLVMQQQKGDATQAATDHPMYNALLHAPNDEMSSMSFQETRTSHCALSGNAYAQIIRRSGTGTAVQLQALDPDQVRVSREKTGQRRIVYTVKTGSETERDYPLTPGKPQDILHVRGLGWDGLVGYSVITMARQSIGTGLAVERNIGRFYANGGRVPYVLEYDKTFKTDQDYDRFRSDWQKVTAQPHLAPILQPGMKYVQTGLSAADAQLIETRLFDIHEICRWFLMSPHLVGDLSRATFSNIEELFLEFSSVTMGPWFNRWEKDCWRCILTSDEKSAGYQFKHDTTELRTGAFLSRMQGYSIGLQNGVYTPNNVLKFLGLNPFAGGDTHHIQMNMQTIQKDGTLLPPAQPAGTPPSSPTKLDV